MLVHCDGDTEQDRDDVVRGSNSACHRLFREREKERERESEMVQTDSCVITSNILFAHSLLVLIVAQPWYASTHATLTLSQSDNDLYRSC